MNKRRDWIAEQVPTEHREVARQVEIGTRRRIPMVRTALMNQLAGASIVIAIADQSANHTMLWVIFTAVGLFISTRRTN